MSRPKRKRKFPRVPTWESIELLLSRITDTRDRALLALLAYGGLRRAEVVKLDMKDYVASFGLRRVQSKGGNEDSVPLPEVARHIIDAYIREQRGEAQVDDPLFVVRFLGPDRKWRIRRMHDNRVYKIVVRLGRQSSLEGLHPHAFRHSCGVELLKRTRGNLRAVQGYLRHADIQTTTLYTHLAPSEMQAVAGVFDAPLTTGFSPAPAGRKSQSEIRQ